MLWGSAKKEAHLQVLVVEMDEVSVRTYVAGRAAQAGETRHEEKQASQG